MTMPQTAGKKGNSRLSLYQIDLSLNRDMLRLTFSFELLVVATGVRHVRSYQESEVTNTLFDKTASSQLPDSKNLVTGLFQSFVNFLFMQATYETGSSKDFRASDHLKG